MPKNIFNRRKTKSIIPLKMLSEKRRTITPKMNKPTTIILSFYLAKIQKIIIFVKVFIIKNTNGKDKRIN
jgi:ABC-type spermidine/putrescine transport system permease subunit II